MYLTKQKGYGRGFNKYELWSERPKPSLFAGSHTVHWLRPASESIDIFCDLVLERFTNVRLKAGEIREVESITFKFVGADG